MTHVTGICRMSTLNDFTLSPPLPWAIMDDILYNNDVDTQEETFSQLEEATQDYTADPTKYRRDVPKFHFSYESFVSRVMRHQHDGQ